MFPNHRLSKYFEHFDECSDDKKEAKLLLISIVNKIHSIEETGNNETAKLFLVYAMMNDLRKLTEILDEKGVI